MKTGKVICFTTTGEMGDVMQCTMVQDVTADYSKE
jgi:hypothetical protein